MVMSYFIIECYQIFLTFMKFNGRFQKKKIFGKYFTKKKKNRILFKSSKQLLLNYMIKLRF